VAAVDDAAAGSIAALVCVDTHASSACAEREDIASAMAIVSTVLRVIPEANASIFMIDPSISP
jgi:hypothetical protein